MGLEAGRFLNRKFVRTGLLAGAIGSATFLGASQESHAFTPIVDETPQATPTPVPPSNGIVFLPPEESARILKEFHEKNIVGSELRAEQAKTLPGIPVEFESVKSEDIDWDNPEGVATQGFFGQKDAYRFTEFLKREVGYDDPNWRPIPHRYNLTNNQIAVVISEKLGIGPVSDTIDTEHPESRAIRTVGVTKTEDGVINIWVNEYKEACNALPDSDYPSERFTPYEVLIINNITEENTPIKINRLDGSCLTTVRGSQEVFSSEDGIPFERKDSIDTFHPRSSNP